MGQARNVTPAVYAKVKKTFGWLPGTVNLDLGSGPFCKLTEALEKHDVENLPYDPVECTPLQNSLALRRGGQRAVTGTISNVLNVIRSPTERHKLLKLSAAEVRRGPVFITVQEGDRKGRGKMTRDGWQANRPLAKYLNEVRRVFQHAEIRNGMIVAW